MKYKFIISGGGTGGHIFPAIAIADALKKKIDCDILFVGAEHKMEMKKVPEAGYPIVALPIRGMVRGSFLKNISVLIQLLISLFKARKIIHQFKPHAVIGVGGYASFPLMFMAQNMKTPTILQEQNAFMGKSNLRLARKAKLLCLAYEEAKRFVGKTPCVITGNPIRKSIQAIQHITTEGAKKYMGLHPQLKTILIVGGSQGAKKMNIELAQILPSIMQMEVQLVWQTGEAFYASATALASTYPGRINVFAFIQEIEQAYQAADFIISRSGAIAVAELSVVAKPVIFVPLPTAAENHQMFNAQVLEQKKAAFVVEEKKIQEQMLPLIQQLLQKDQLYDTMSRNMKMQAITNADERIAEEIIQLLHNYELP